MKLPGRGRRPAELRARCPASCSLCGFVRWRAEEDAMGHILQLTVVAFVCACTYSPRAPTPTPDTIPSMEYDLFATIIRGERDSIVEPDSTHSMPCRSVDQCPWRLGGAEPATWGAYITANRTSARVSSDLLRKRGLTLVSRSYRPSSRACSGPRWIALARAGFGPDSTEALVQYSVSTGAGPYPGCGWAAGGMYLYRRSADGTWRRTKVFDQWIT